LPAHGAKLAPMQALNTVYLAGFDVFRPDARAHGTHLKALCAAHGWVGLYPLDNDVPAALAGPAAARWIYQANLALIQRADAVLANVNAFRGAEPDSGTAFEIGYATALGKPVWAYTSDPRPLIEQVACNAAQPGHWVDAKGYTVEDFGLSSNLMLACAATKIVHGDAAAALAAMAPAYPATPASIATPGAAPAAALAEARR